MKKLTFLLFVCLLLLGLTGCEGTPAASETAPAPESSEATESTLPTTDSLVVYFSATGNTEAVARFLAETQGAELQEIVPEDPYTEEDLDYNDEHCRANHEQNDPDARPAIANIVKSIERYDIIYVGFPIWWGTMPKILYTFFDTYDLTGKTIVPFCTSGGSGIEEAMRVITELEPETTITEGLRTDPSRMTTDVPAWLDAIGLAQ